MSNTYHLIKEPFYNPYRINGYDVGIIIFYDDNGLVFKHEKGWFGYNNDRIQQLEDIAFVKRRVFDLTRKENFFCGKRYVRSGNIYVGTTLYIYSPLVDFELIGEKKASETEHEVNYLTFFKLFGKEYSAPFYSKTELTPKGEQLKKLKNLFEGCEHGYEFFRIIQNRFNELKQIMEQ